MNAKNLSNRNQIKINGRFRKIRMVVNMPLIEEVSVIFMNGDTIRYAANQKVDAK